MKKSSPVASPLEVDRGPNWLFVKLSPGRSKSDLAQLASNLWEIVDTHFVYRLVVEMDDFEALPDLVIQQLAELRQRLEDQRGALRVCGLRKSCVVKLENFRLDHVLHNSATRASAVLGADPARDSLPTAHFYPKASRHSAATPPAMSGTAAEVALTR